ncbi:MAG: Eco57I restriction-modification methylase domain-containing protein [Bryobacterales bacterium]|nr:Eco57I restriction-modification methylase domain-containing protein [Bryobacterales bacterium]
MDALTVSQDRPSNRPTEPKARQGMMFAPQYDSAARTLERNGVVYTKDWVVDFLLDLAGYTEDTNLVDALAVEPAAGEGAFLVRMAERLILSCRRQSRPIGDCRTSLIACELDDSSAEVAKKAVHSLLGRMSVPDDVAQTLVESWIRTGDYLFEAFRLPPAQFVIGNPPYIRLENIPEEVAGLYRDSYPTMTGRADLYVAFFEAGLSQLTDGGVCAFICADRWMLNQYGAKLRSLVSSRFAVETIVEMHDADAFQDDVSAYPAITIIRRGHQQDALVARAKTTVESRGGKALAQALAAVRSGNPTEAVPGLTCSLVHKWFRDSDPWPCSSPARLALLRRLEEEFEPLESEGNAVKVGIGVATGLDEVFITKDGSLVESSRLLPLALARDTLTGHLRWSGHYLIDPWTVEGLVDLGDYPRLKEYFEQRAELVKRRNTAQRNPRGWYRTIDRVAHSLTAKPKLYIPDIKNQLNPVLDCGTTYPHHNLYFVHSDVWDLEVLGGILLSAVGQLFIEAYGVRMRGGYLRFQAQYLRRIRIPAPDSIPPLQRSELARAFRERDRRLATEVALQVYGIRPAEMEASLEY